MSDPTAKERVAAVFKEYMGVEVTTWDERLSEDLDLDSLDRVELTIALERKFGLFISEDVSDSWLTAGDILRDVEGWV